MTEHPILFSAPMILRLIGDAKHVTRRLSKRWLRVKRGDVLWVRETWASYCENTTEQRAEIDGLWDQVKTGQIDIVSAAMNIPKAMGPVKALYCADFGGPGEAEDTKWRPSIHMPRWASRITLEAIEDARPEPLHAITEAEAVLEGVESVNEFVGLWNGLHNKEGERYGDNPEVVRVAFRRIA